MSDDPRSPDAQNAAYLRRKLEEARASLAAMTRERDEMIAAYDNCAALALTYMGQRDAAMAALRDIAEGSGVPDSMLQSKEVFREQFAPFLQHIAKAALNATTPDQGKPTKEYFDVQPPGDDPQKIG